MLSEERIETFSPDCGSGVCLVNHFQGRVSCPQGQASPTYCQTDAQCDFDEPCLLSVVGNACDSSASCPENQFCDEEIGSCVLRVCSGGSNEAEHCKLPKGGGQVAVSVCGQCNPGSKRDAASAVYCSCRCGVAEGEPEDDSANLCVCPDGFECAEIRKNLGLGNEKLTGKYCIRAGTKYVGDNNCGAGLLGPAMRRDPRVLTSAD